jgi:hypothetical protein
MTKLLRLTSAIIPNTPVVLVVSNIVGVGAGGEQNADGSWPTLVYVTAGVHVRVAEPWDTVVAMLEEALGEGPDWHELLDAYVVAVHEKEAPGDPYLTSAMLRLDEKAAEQLHRFVEGGPRG